MINSQNTAPLDALPVGGVIWLVTHKSPNRRTRRHGNPDRTGRSFYIPKSEQRPSRNVPFVKAAS